MDSTAGLGNTVTMTPQYVVQNCDGGEDEDKTVGTTRSKSKQTVSWQQRKPQRRDRVHESAVVFSSSRTPGDDRVRTLGHRRFSSGHEMASLA